MEQKQKALEDIETIYIIDFDSTLVTLESLDELAAIALENRPDKSDVLKELEKITDQGMTGQIQFDESLNKRLKLFKANKSHVHKTAKLLIENISPSVLKNNQWFLQNRQNIFVISGGFYDYILPVIIKIGLSPEKLYANHFTYDTDGNITGYDKTNDLSKSQGKVKQIKKLGLNNEKVIMIGDGFTDSEVKTHGAADEFWAFTETVSRPAVTQLADKKANSFSEVVKFI